jgi:hypothetical protein
LEPEYEARWMFRPFSSHSWPVVREEEAPAEMWKKVR